MSILNITNGDSAGIRMQQAGIEGDVVCWRDVLHEGPVPMTETLAELSSIRASFISSKGWGEQGKVRKAFLERDRALKNFRHYQRLVLWFEHDLYDQLQLLQILHWLQAQDRTGTQIDLICVNEYLGELGAEGRRSLAGRSSTVSVAQMELARKSWLAFCSPDPRHWENLLNTDSSSLPYLKGAIVRHLEQYPHTKNGLNRTERQILEAVVLGHSQPLEIFDYNQQADGIRFMGDSVFWRYLQDLVGGHSPLLRTRGGVEFRPPQKHLYPQDFVEQELTLSDTGQAVIQNDTDWLSIKPLDKWYGGVRLKADNIWRWDEQAGRLKKTGGQYTY